jgi:hypothetical protein
LKAVDFAIIAGAILLMGFWQRGISLASRLWIITFLFTFYFSCNEWTHCQRDPWTLLPVLAALHLRRGQVEAVATGRRSTPKLLLVGFIEGLLWGLAIWIKPYAVVPALFVWLVGTHWLWRTGAKPTHALSDFAGLILGGLTCGALGILWMKWHHCWEPYLEHMRNLQQFYFAADMYSPFTMFDWRWHQFLSFYPWSLLAIGGLVFGGWYLARGWHRTRKQPTTGSLALQMFAATLIGYFVESYFLQHVFDYALVPVLMLGLAWVGISLARTTHSREQFALGFLCFVFVFMGHVPILKQRLPVWERCLQEGSTWEMRNHLMIMKRTEWNDLIRIRDFLRSRNVQDGQLTVFVEGGLPLYEELGLRPTTRSYMMTNQIISLPYRRPQIFDELVASKQKYVFTSTIFLKRDRTDLNEEPAREGDPLPWYWHGSRDWTQYIVCRAGVYLILELPPELTSDWAREVLGL